ncbi:ATP-dependent DNA helicase PIF1 [Collichthys lucidus]|uniref:ATP-dependent DNA helicase n=1 Tax=Collichthys lucidus TaxID=240159 RepID=A0A4V6AMQ7_COLLU|nr:ATP-dependent DNA helicase PIF1 [Collichthys lucidus]
MTVMLYEIIDNLMCLICVLQMQIGDEVGHPRVKKAQTNSKVQKSVSNVQKSVSNVQKSVSNVQKSVSNVQKSVSKVPKSSKTLSRSLSKNELKNLLSKDVSQIPSYKDVSQIPSYKDVSQILSYKDVLQNLPDSLKKLELLPEKDPSHSQFAIKFDLCHEKPSLCSVVEQSECNECTFVTKPHNFSDRSVLMGSFHQGHSQFGNVRNKQCGAISLTAVLKSKIKNVWTWDSGDLDDVLINGTGLYRSMSVQKRIKDSVASRGYIAVSELPKQQRMWNCNFAITFAESYTGSVNVDDYDHALQDVAMPFDEALQRALFGNDACLLTVCASTCAIVNESGRFAFVDSHASTRVNQQGESASYVAHLSSVQSLVNFVYDYARSFDVTTPSFEVTGVKVVSVSSIDTQMNEPLSSHVTTNPTNSRPLYSKVVKGEQRGCNQQSAVGKLTKVASNVGNVCNKTVRSAEKRSHMNEPALCDVSTTNATNTHPLSSKKVKGEGKFAKQQSSVGGQIKVANNENNVNNKTASSVKVNADPDVNRCLDADDVIVSSVTIAKQPFKPLTLQDRDDLCNKLGLANENADKHQMIADVNDMGCPCNIKSIKPDGNCFYRSLAFSVCHAEEKHLKIRRAVVRHLQSNSGTFAEYLRNEYTSVQDYVTKSRIYYCGSWATEIDIFAAADLLQTTICTFNDGKWNMHKPTTSPQTCLQNCIYLNHTGNHYEVVTCVKSKDAEGLCAGICQPLNSDDNLRSQRKRNFICETKAVKAKKERLRYNDIEYKKRKLQSLKENYKDVSVKQAKCEVSRERCANEYKSNPDFKRYKRSYFVTRYHTNAKCQKQKRDTSKITYANNPSFQARVKDYSKAKYKTNTEFNSLVRDYSKAKYKTNTEFNSLVREYSKAKYKTNTEFNSLVRDYSKAKYKTNTEFNSLVRDYSKAKYKTNTEFNSLVRKYSKAKYKTNTEFNSLVRDYSRMKYKNITFQNKIKEDNQRKYRNNQNIRVHKINEGCASYARWKKNQEDINSAIAHFREEVSCGPEYVCSVCHRLLFRKQVIECKRQSYENKHPEVSALAKRCITLQYLHVCDINCQHGCPMSDSPSSKLWICFTCHRKILARKLPEESVTNNMHLDEIPAELKCLNSLEQHLIARHIPFMKLLCLPRGRQRGCHGPCVSVPVNNTDVANLLPRNECDDKMIRVKLKRKLTYKGHYEYMYVRTDRVRNALRFLMTNNKWYSDVAWNNEWVNTLNGTDENDEQNINQKEAGDSDDDNVADEETEQEKEEDITYIKDQSGLLSDTSLQPVDLGSEIVDQNFQDILNVAPGEGNSPVRLLSDKTNEAKCFPVLYPLGGPTFHDDRESKITLARYLNTRILNADGRFGRNTDFIFYAQYMSEVYQVVSNVSVALRKGDESSLKEASPDMFLNSESLSKIFCNDEGYKFLRGIRGTPPYWMSVQKDLFAMIRQLSIPTFFASFSSADLRWPEMLNSILRLERKTTCVDDLDWSDKCGLIRRNPVTAARMFDHRWHCFLNDVILSQSQPIGKVIDYFYRVEFQQRGSPHVHCLFWVENAPRIDRETDAEVTHFIDTYITCETPLEADAELYEVVNSVQKHSTRHSKTCRKKKTVCRFNFPRPPSRRTFITRAVNSEDSVVEADIAHAHDIMKRVKSALTKPDMSFDSTDAFFKCLGINQGEFEKAYNICSKKKSIVLKRNATDIWVNQYNKDLLRAWNGNMDIQYVTDAFAVVVYILSYITKAEQEMGLLLQRAQNEAMNGNLDAKAAFKQLGSVYLHNREISAQEAVYRLTHMHLKECSRDVQFIAVGGNPVRMSLPLHVLQAKAQKEHCDDAGNIWMTNVVERYKNRPHTAQFEEVCLASFCSEYRILSKSQVSADRDAHDIIALRNNCGFVKQRTRTQPAVVRYPRFSPTKNTEKYFRSLLQLFLPYYNDCHLKPPQFDTYEDFYNNGAVKCGNDVQKVSVIVDSNKALFEKETEDIDRAKKLLDQNIDLEDAWAQICPETEKERLHCLDLMKDKAVDDEGDDDDELIPDLTAKPHTACTLETNHVTMPRQDALHLLRSLNEEQAAIFFAVRKWCLQKLLGQNPEPLRLFITGGAGTGKSHLIKAIHYESTRLLSQIAENPDTLTVLLTAPTGVAAYNIGAATIHNTFSIGANATLPYQPLSDEKVNSLRTKMSNVHILIIDEISMVDHRLLAYIHGRLRQIKQTGDYSLFANVALICVGDFYQLKPVKGRQLFTDSKGANLWENNFEVAQLTKVVRQENAGFAEMLNRLRTHTKDKPLDDHDVLSLTQCETGEESTDIHIYATNAEVDEYNIKRLHETCPDAISIQAHDFVRSPKTGRMEPKVGFHRKVFNSCLPECVSLGVGARVMLKKNIDVSDGLVNGACGTVVKIIKGKDDDDLPAAIHVEFENPNVGKIQRLKAKRVSEHSTIIEVQEDQVTHDGGIRRQVPLCLSWAVTIHKCQGLTVERAVVSLKKIFAPGQAYVALSRLKSLGGLQIEDFKQSAIYCDNKITLAMESMPAFKLVKTLSCDVNPVCTIALHNVQSLKAHILDIEAHKALMKADCICLTETWLDVNPKEEPQLAGHVFHHNPRGNCYDDSDPMFAVLKQQQRGGVGMYCSENIDVQVLLPEKCNIECLYFEMQHVNLCAAVVYRPNSYKVDMFRQKLLQVIFHLDKHAGRKMIMGDFNEDILVSSSIQKLLEQHGYTQHVRQCTTEKGTLIDHVYVKDTEDVIVEVIQTYYSFHDAVLISLI